MLLDERVVTLRVAGALSDEEAERAVALFAALLRDAAGTIAVRLGGSLDRDDVEVSIDV